jgi:hypothetical protein
MKQCTKCGKEKRLRDFNKSGGTKDGLNAWCRACTKAYRPKNNWNPFYLVTDREYDLNLAFLGDKQSAGEYRRVG